MPLLKNNEFIDDTWHRLDEGEAIPQTGDILVPLARLLADFGKLSKRQGRLGVEFPNEVGNTANINELLVEQKLVPARTDSGAPNAQSIICGGPLVDAARGN